MLQERETSNVTSPVNTGVLDIVSVWEAKSKSALKPTQPAAYGGKRREIETTAESGPKSTATTTATAMASQTPSASLNDSRVARSGGWSALLLVRPKARKSISVAASSPTVLRPVC